MCSFMKSFLNDYLLSNNNECLTSLLVTDWLLQSYIEQIDIKQKAASVWLLHVRSFLELIVKMDDNFAPGVCTEIRLQTLPPPQ